MHIVQVYHSPVPVALYGGMERVIESLIDGFLALGHRVSLISYKGDYEIPGVNHYYLDQFSSMEEALERYPELIPEDADVLHYHVPFQFKDCGLPYLMTLHGNLKEDEDPSTLPKNTIFISKRHAENHKGERFIYHGMDYSKVPFSSVSLKERAFYGFLGRASLRRKGLKEAKSLAKRLQVPLHVGGGRGFSWCNTKYLGHLNNEQKFDLLQRSKALLFPISWEEPFGLVMIEAMFCGTPVFAFERGSVGEVLNLEGAEELFLRAHNEDELFEKIKKYNFNNDPMAIREYAIKHFSHTAMCARYIEEFERAKIEK